MHKEFWGIGALVINMLCAVTFVQAASPTIQVTRPNTDQSLTGSITLPANAVPTGGGGVRPGGAITGVQSVPVVASQVPSSTAAAAIAGSPAMNLAPVISPVSTSPSATSPLPLSVQARPSTVPVTGGAVTTPASAPGAAITTPAPSLTPVPSVGAPLPTSGVSTVVSTPALMVSPLPSTVPSTPSLPTTPPLPTAQAAPSAPPLPTAQPSPTPPTPAAPPVAPTPAAVPSKPPTTLASQERKAPVTTAHLKEPAGNWLNKRIWWEDAQDLYGKIKKSVDQIFELRMSFFNKRSELSRTLFDPFYIHAGLGRGELEELLNYLKSEVEAQRTKQGVLNEQERAFLDVMAQENATLEQLKLDIEAITKLDNALDDALARLMDQLNLCRKYEQEAWESFKTIAEVLNDKRARELYYAMVTNQENILAIHNYIKKDLNNYFDQLTKTATENVNRIKTALQKLKEKGIDFKKKAQELEQQDSAAVRDKARIEQERLEQELEEAERKAQQGWFGWLYDKIRAAWGSVTSMVGTAWNTVKGWFVRSPAPEQPPAPSTPALPVPPPAVTTTQQGAGASVVRAQ